MIPYTFKFAVEIAVVPINKRAVVTLRIDGKLREGGIVVNKKSEVSPAAKKLTSEYFETTIEVLSAFL